MVRGVILFGFFVAISASSPCLAQSQTIHWGNVGTWEIRVDRTINDSCYVSSKFEKGSTLRFGINKTRNRQGYMLIGNRNWTSLQIGREYEVKFRFDDSTIWRASALAVKLEGYNHFLINFDKREIFQDFIRRNWVHVFLNDNRLTSLSMKASSAAFSEMVRCQQQMDNATSPSRIPNEVPRGNNQDPFKS